MARTQFGAQVTLLTHRAGGGHDVSHRLAVAADHDVVFRQHDDAAGGFGDRLVDAIEQLAHHRATVHKIRLGGGDAASAGDHIAQRRANRHRDRDRVRHRTRNGQRALSHRRAVVHRTRQVDQRQHIVDRHTHVLR